ncbi:ATP-binding protein [Niveispirillum fermenti]|uniref:ATP-binding protein n=1 Tax=Niveispirillum fermenti TaxID=1233113 RepID=UPI003A858824
MNIRTRIVATLIFAAVAVAVSVGAALWAWGMMGRLTAHVTETHALVRTIFELSLLTREYSDTGSERALFQWQRGHANLDMELSRLLDASTDEIDQTLLKRLKLDNAMVRPVLERYALDHTDPEAANTALASLMLRFNVMASDADRLAANANARVNQQGRLLLLLQILPLALLAPAVALALAASQRVIGGLQRVGQGVEAIGGGNLGHRLDVSGQDEFAQLSAGVNRMAIQLQALYADIAGKMEALSVAKQLAEAGEKAKGAFLANMSHEIRTPLNAVIGFADLLRDGTAPVADREKWLGLQMEAARALIAIVDDVLDLSKIEAGRLDLEPAALDPAALAESCVALLMPRAADKGLAIRAALADDLPNWVVGDAVRLRQILLNLLSNAVKFTSTGGVTLSLVRHGSSLVFTVSDTGMGIPPERQQHLFMPFSQLDASITRRFGGTGLGLAITKRLVDAMGGSIALDSRPGQGSQFHVTLPLPEARAPRIQPEPEPQAALPSYRPLTILLAEDVFANQMLVRAILERAGHRVQVVENGQEAVDMLATAGDLFDLVLMDVQMPIMDGMEATRRIRKAGARLPILALTANVLREEREACEAAGMSGHLAKPLTPQALNKAIAEIAGFRFTRADALPAPSVADAPDPTPALPTDPPAGDTVLVMDVLEELLAVTGDEIGITLLQDAMESFKVRCDAILNAGGDLACIEREAHALVSTAGNLGFMPLSQQARKMMNAAADHDQGRTERLLRDLPDLCAAALTVGDDMLKRLHERQKDTGPTLA